MPKDATRYTPEAAEALFENMIAAVVDERSVRLSPSKGDQVRAFAHFLRAKTAWFTSPASTKYHLSVPGGLLMHSVAVASRALTLKQVLMDTIPTDSVLLCGLFHDIGKIYSRTGPNGEWIPRYEPNWGPEGQPAPAYAPYRYIEGANEIPLTVKDMLLVAKHIDLSDAEMQALMLADGQYVQENKKLEHNEHPLGLIIHWADYWEGHVMEGGIQADWLSGVFATR